MLAEMDCVQWDKWLAFFAVEPFGTVQDDLRAALIVQKIHNANCTRRSDMIRATDVFPWLDVGREPPAPEEVAVKVEQVFLGWCV